MIQQPIKSDSFELWKRVGRGYQFVPIVIAFFLGMLGKWRGVLILTSFGACRCALFLFISRCRLRWSPGYGLICILLQSCDLSWRVGWFACLTLAFLGFSCLFGRLFWGIFWFGRVRVGFRHYWFFSGERVWVRLSRKKGSHFWRGSFVIHPSVLWVSWGWWESSFQCPWSIIAGLLSPLLLFLLTSCNLNIDP